MSWTRRRRFWETATVRREEAGLAVALDERLLRTPAGALLVVPTEPLAAAIAAEWNAVEAEIDPGRLPHTRMANSAIDRVEPQREAVIDTVAAYGGTDLLCYRAERPEALVARQAAGWDPWLAWADRVIGAPLVTATGIMHRAQPPASLAALRAAVATEDAFGLVALHDLATLSGSLVLGLAVRRDALAPDPAWALSRIDEAWQAEQWGLDSEAEAVADAGRSAFADAASFSASLRLP